MKDQHEKIKGYRDLSQSEIDLMNRIKAHAEESAALLGEVALLRREHQAEPMRSLSDEQFVESSRCLAIAKNHLQTGQMWFVRAIALPNSF